MSSIDRESDQSADQSSLSKIKPQRPSHKQSRRNLASQDSGFKDSDSSQSSNSGSSLYDQTGTRDASGSFFSAKADPVVLNLAKLHSHTQT